MVKQERIPICSWEEVQTQSHSFNCEEEKTEREKLEREYPEVWSDFSLEVVDKTLVSILLD